MLAIEIDGASHTEKYDYDIKRQTRLQNIGVRFIRFTDSDVKQNMQGVLAALEAKIAEIIDEERS